MGLSRLDNFLKSSRGTILYVNPNDLDATDSVENQGNSLTRPFKTIQRALIESARFSYQQGLDNDRFAKTTILLYPGDHIIDNRPGLIPDGSNQFRQRDGSTTNNLPPFDLSSNFDLVSPDNELYKLNSINGGAIIPRGTSLVGLDLRKTKIRPKYVPNPSNTNIERSCIFRVTGECYFWQFTILDGDPNGNVYKDYTSNTFLPTFSHHKLAGFEFADGTNGVDISDTFLTYKTGRTDLDMYYEKLSLVYGTSSGRSISPDYPSASLDIQPKVDEYRIVGSTGASIGISSIKAGDGSVSTTDITVTTASEISGLDVDTPFSIDGISATGYDGEFVVSEKLSSTQIKYKVQTAPASALPTVSGSTLSLTSDTVTSASPYILNISLRSVYGMCGLLADGAKSSGFKSMVVAQYTGIGLQKDDNAFVLYNSSGNYDDSTVSGVENLSSNSKAIYKPDYKNFHLKITNNAFIQAASVFAVGYAQHFVTENGGDLCITNSNSNFGAAALAAIGFRSSAYTQDDVGYITHIIPPKQIPTTETSLEFEAIDVEKTDRVVGVGSTGNLYLTSQTNADVAPENVIAGYRIGVRESENLGVLVSYAGSLTEYNARIVMHGSQKSSKKSSIVSRSGSTNSISSNVLTLTAAHEFINGESIRVISDDGHLPDGINYNIVYYAITSGTGISANTEIKLAKTLSDATNNNPITINNKGGVLTVESRVSDKNTGDIGHPVQWDSTNSQWYVGVSTASDENTIHSRIVGLGTTGLGLSTPRTFIKRCKDSRGQSDTVYRARYVIPSSASGRPPTNGFIVQESNTSIGYTDTEVETYFGSGSISNINQQRNFRFISGVTWDGASYAKVSTELPHELCVGSGVELFNVKSSTNTTGVGASGYNRYYEVVGVSSAKEFTVGLTTNPGTFTNDTSTRTVSLPYLKKKRYKSTYYIHKSEEHRPHIKGEQDGVYYLTLVNSSNKPTSSPFTNENFSQPVKDLYPQTQRDNPLSDPQASKSFARSKLIGSVVIDDVKNSITRETLDKYLQDATVGMGVTDVVTNVGSSGTIHTIRTGIDHGLNRVTKVTIAEGGCGYGDGSAGDLYNARLEGVSTGINATAKVTVGSTGEVTAVTIMDGGSAYGIGNTMVVTGITTTGSGQYWNAVVTVSKIYDNTNDVVKISGISSSSYSLYNNLYRITSVEAGAGKTFEATSASAVTNFSIVGVGTNLSSGAYYYNVGKSKVISALDYDYTTGIATVTTATAHGVRVYNKIKIAGAAQTQYNGDFVVTENVNATKFKANLGITTISPTATGGLNLYFNGISSNDGNLTDNDESLNGRMVPIYGNLTTTASAGMTDITDEISVTGVADLDIIIGDYLQIDDEIVRVKTTNAGSNPIKIFRGVLGTIRKAHLINTIVKRIIVNPVEFRRHSIIRASGHTFEYVGYGPGNYSTAFPERQDRSLSEEEELLTQSIKRDGGVNFYTAMNDKGISYSGNKKLNIITGKEELFDTPIRTTTGENIGETTDLNIINPTEGNFERAIRVEGGSDQKASSEFNGPVIINKKLTVNHDVEGNSIFLQGDATVSRKYTVGISTPSAAGNSGDVKWTSNPSKGNHAGWVYTSDNDWYRYAPISLSKTSNMYIFDQVGVGTGIGTTTSYLLEVGTGSTSKVIVNDEGVGIGTTPGQHSLRVNGTVNIGGTCTAHHFVGDGSALTNIIPSGITFDAINVSGIVTASYFEYGVGAGISLGTPESTHTFALGIGGTERLGITSTGDVTFTTNTGKFFKYVTNDSTSSSNAGGGFYNNASSTAAIRRSILWLDANGGNFSGTDYFYIDHHGDNHVDIRNSSNGRMDFFTNDARRVCIEAAGNVGIASTIPTATLDVEGTTRLRSYHEDVSVVIPDGSQDVTLDLSSANSFICTAISNIARFRLTNIPSEGKTFTLRIDQDATGSRQVGIDTFHAGSGAAFPVHWPGSVVPVVTPTASRSDIYSFKIFNGSTIANHGIYGVVNGQNFL